MRRAAENTFLSAEGAENGFLIREGARRGAKNTEYLWEVSCVNARTGLILLPQIAVQPTVNEP